MTRAYRPANGTEGEAFADRLCRRCACDSEEALLDMSHDGCPLLADALAGAQPSQWVQDVPGIEGPTCKAFVERQEGETIILDPYQAERDLERYNALPRDPETGRPVI